ncbi:hypothetical protein F5883DRAFT_680525 [Diaporthe sp. PMI_573]|nr:hypothetical protein F5883DRAFT_680525 [Diaporthaceae sp. PMI_573]
MIQPRRRGNSSQQVYVTQEAALWSSLNPPRPDAEVAAEEVPYPAPSCLPLPSSLALPRFERAQIRSATCTTLSSPLPRLFNARKVTATLVGRYPPPCQLPPLQADSPATYLGLVIYPSRIPPTAASSNRFIRTLPFTLSCLVLSCRAILLLLAAIRFLYNQIQYLQHLSASIAICHVRHNVLSICTAPHRTAPSLLFSSSLCSTWVHLGSSPTEQSLANVRSTANPK